MVHRDIWLWIVPSYHRHEMLTIDAFDLLKVIGKGSFGMVMQLRKKDTQHIYALKTIRKANIASRPGEITHILAERTVLALVNYPFIVPLKFSFQNPDKLYLVMSFGAFRQDIKAISDLKPENILLDYTGHIALCDFGLCKLNMLETDRTNSTLARVFMAWPVP